MKTTKHKISFCIVCMNRLHQLKETLLQNIIDNIDYEELEFIVLDYNSEDGMEEWIKESVNKYINNGKVFYYKTYDPQFFSHSHAKNLCFNLATGDIVCNINADHFTGCGFANYINDKFNQDNNIVLTPIDFYNTNKDYLPPKDVLGKVCVRKADFLKIKGFDEYMNTYGFEDYDFVNRLEMLGVRRVLIEDFSFLKFLPHDDNERYSLIASLNNINSLYVHYCTPSLSEFIILYNNYQFKKGAIIDNSTIGADNYIYSFQIRNYYFEFSLQNPHLEEGVWLDDSTNNCINFNCVAGNNFTLQKVENNNNSVVKSDSSGKLFYLIRDLELIRSIVAYIISSQSREIMEKNLKEKIIIGNKGGFGKAVVYKNFTFDSPIFI